MTKLKRILLAEDNPKDIELTLEAFEDNKIANEVVVARDGAEALDYLYCRGKSEGRAEGDPVVVLLDVKMTKVNGLEVLKQIRADPYFKHLPVVMVTASREEQDLVKSYELGVNAYVVKPVGFQEFTDAIKQIGAFWGVLNETPANGAAQRHEVL